MAGKPAFLSKAQLDAPLRVRNLEQIAGGLAPVIKEAIAEAVAPLERRIKELEARPAMKYCGVFDATKVYHVGDFVTDGGSLWHCADTNIGARPGSSEAWQLAVKRGRDGKGR